VSERRTVSTSFTDLHEFFKNNPRKFVQSVAKNALELLVP